jgi:SAM-dependent methyltransferase
MGNEVHNCPACGAAGHVPVAKLDAQRAVRFREFDERKYGGVMSRWNPAVEPEIVGCVSCGHAWYRWQPSGEQLGNMYESGRPLSGIPPSVQPTAGMLAEMRRVHAAAGCSSRRPSLLDYGSGFGRWARAAAAAGFVVTAFEPSSTRSADRDSTFEFVTDPRELEGRQFDVVQLEQVLEHVTEPARLLRDLAPRLERGGLLRLTVPNILRAPEGARIWELWPYDGVGPHTMAPFEHLHGFTPASLEAVGRRAGLEPAAGWRIWRHYAINEARRRVGRLWARFGTTTLFLTHGNAA